MPVPGQAIAIVDPVSGAVPYGAETTAMGLRPLAVMTQEFRTPYVADSFLGNTFSEIHRHTSVADTLAFLKDRGVAAVVPGTQTALDVTDLLAEGLGLIGNPVASIRARTDKRVMKEYWREHGVACADHMESTSLPAVLSWAEATGYPIVLKPPASSGASHVYVCTDEREVAGAFRTILDSPDLYDRTPDAVLAEEYLDGDEYFMNLLHDGTPEAALVSVARYEKIQRDGHPSIYRTFKSLPLDDPLAQDVLPYIRSVNSAIGVRYGINDTEFKMTSRGPRVIEVNNRLPGASTPLMIQKCSGLNTFQDSVRIFLGAYTRPPEYRFHRHYCVCCLINHRPGRVLGHQGAAEVAKLPSYDGHRMIAKVGAHWPVTRDMVTAWGLVRLVHEDPAQLDRDAEAVHALMRLRVE
ncbi:ATP-grasp domain-containing protein [Streptomyces sp. NPDC057302]|uniref:ATP-grasp domain-containing protein n=1 Tax=Streptomyces sp. NPDC057302 TaxID=3346094 RepID=UPI003633D299